MKNRFPGYFDLSEAEHDKLWDEGLIVVDTNVLLDLYRVPEQTRNRMFEMLQSLKGRIWVPHQVGVEFLGMRVKTINEVHRRSATVVDDLTSKHGAFRTAAEEMKLAERGLDDVQGILEQIDALVKEFSERARAALSGALKPTEHDHVLDRINAIVDGNVGEAPPNQEFLSKIYKEGENRYELKMGPGFEDAKKAEGKSARYLVGGLIYESQYSDLVLWKQTIAHVKNSGAKNVLFLSKDAKKDWWQIVNGEDRIAPLPELREEIIREGGAESFWMITLQNALAKYGARTGLDVEQAIEDVKRAEDSDSMKVDYLSSYSRMLDAADPFHLFRECENRIDDVAAAMNLEVAYRSQVLLGGRSKFHPSVGLLITSVEHVRENPFHVVEKARDASTVLMGIGGVSTLHVFVVVPKYPSEEVTASAKGFGQLIWQNLSTPISRVIVGFEHAGLFVSVHEAVQKHQPR